MRMTSVFCAECVCGSHFETPERQFTCLKCGRVIVLEWGFPGPATHSESSDEAVETEAAA